MTRAPSPLQLACMYLALAVLAVWLAALVVGAVWRWIF